MKKAARPLGSGGFLEIVPGKKGLFVRLIRASALFTVNRVVNGSELVGQARTERANDSGDRHGDTGSNQAIFDRRCTRFIRNKILQKLAHNKPPWISDCRQQIHRFGSADTLAGRRENSGKSLLAT